MGNSTIWWATCLPSGSDGGIGPRQGAWREGTEVGGLNAPMEESYEAFGLDPAETTSLEGYLEEYFSSILKRLREMEADLDKDAKKKLPF